MPLLPPTKAFLGYLGKNPGIRTQIRAAPDKTLLYAGNFFKPVWKELALLKQTNPQVADKEILPDVLARIALPGQAFPTLLEWAKFLDNLSPWKENGFIAWRALSGIFASNAVGKVSFYIGSNVTRTDKVFAATELYVLKRNSNIDPIAQDILEYYLRCVASRQANMNFAYMAS